MGLDWIDSIELDWTGLDWIRLVDWIGLARAFWAVQGLSGLVLVCSLDGLD